MARSRSDNSPINPNNQLKSIMSQKFKKLQNNNDESTAYGKWFATAVYDQHFIETEELANFIQSQASVKKSDVKAVLDELGGAMKHFFELGQKVKLEGIGTFKVGFSSIGSTTKDDCGAQNITTRRVGWSEQRLFCAYHASELTLLQTPSSSP